MHLRCLPNTIQIDEECSYNSYFQKFSSNSTYDSSEVSLTYFKTIRKFLLSDMHLMVSMVSAIISKLDPHKAYRLNGITELEEECRGLNWVYLEGN